MSSTGTTTEISPHDETRSAKRRRIAFSCFECRRRKLKCDRLFPSCSRCLKGGSSEGCSYDSEAVESGQKSYVTRDLQPGGSTAVTQKITRLPSLARSFIADDGDTYVEQLQHAEDTASRLSAQDERIRQLEYRIIGLEKAARETGIQRLGSSNNREPFQTEPTSAPDVRELAKKETMNFRGKSFKTQFFGASHHASCLSHVRAHYHT